LFGKTLKKLFKSSSLRKAAWLLILAASALPLPAGVKNSSEPRVHFISIDGTINPAVDDFIREGIARARLEGAKALIIQLDTPGGLLESTRSIVKEMLGSPVPVIVYVAPSGSGAASAGTFITMAAHIAAMAPGTNIGAAHPVAGSGEEVKGVMGEKIENFTASFGETIAQKRGRNTDWAIQAVRKSVSITEKEALKKNVIDIVAANLDDLLQQADGRKVDLDGKEVVLTVKNARIERFEMSLKQKILDKLSHPNIAYLLMMAGILGLYMEFSHPGVIFPGVAGAICLLLAFISLQILPINYGGLILILLGISLLIAEAFVPSFGVLGVGGGISLALGSLLLFDTESSDLTLDRSIVFAAVGTLSAYMLIVGYLVLRTQKKKAMVGLEGMVGEIGEVKVALNPNGKIFVHGEYWSAEAEDQVAVGEKVRVVGFDGMCLKVDRLSPGRQGS
jgi:membrane-bound serine protease (ClpP class)